MDNREREKERERERELYKITMLELKTK